jgi:hypothetical protein
MARHQRIWLNVDLRLRVFERLAAVCVPAPEFVANNSNPSDWVDHEMEDAR